MSKHTPGPWRVVEDRVPASLEVYAGKTAIAECWRRADALTELANARLVAAAPELLQSLQEVIQYFDAPGDGCFSDAQLAKARAAISNATGGEG